MAKLNQYPGPNEAVAAYDRVIATVPGVERKGAKMPYTSVNGNMSSYLAEDGTLALRLSPTDLERFMAEFGASLNVTYGHVQKEYVAVPAVVFQDAPTLAPWFAASWGYVSSLKPKPTTRRKPETG
jgi:hypothetical protein